MAELNIEIAEFPQAALDTRPGSLEAQIQLIMDVAAAEADEWVHGRNVFWSYLVIGGRSVAEAVVAAIEAATEDETQRAMALAAYEELRKLSPKERIAAAVSGKTDTVK